MTVNVSALLIQQVLCTWRVVQVSQWLCVFIVFCEFFLVCFVVDLDILFAGDLRHQFSRSAWGFCLEDLLVHACICRAWVMAIDASLTVIVVVGWVSLWYSWRPHNVLVVFVGKVALWLWGWSPWLSLSLLRSAHLVSAFVHHNDCIDCIDCNLWWHLLHPLQLAMALLPAVARCNCA
jgi:hypothetical protein